MYDVSPGSVCCRVDCEHPGVASDSPNRWPRSVRRTPMQPRLALKQLVIAVLVSV